MRVVKREKLSSTIMKNLNTLKVNDSWWSNERARFNYHQLSSTIIDYHAPFDQGFIVDDSIDYHQLSSTIMHRLTKA